MRRNVATGLGLLLCAAFVVSVLLSAGPPPSAGEREDQKQTEVLERIADALEKIAEKECACGD